MNRITLECLNNLLNPVNMRFFHEEWNPKGDYCLKRKIGDSWRYLDTDDDITTPEDLGFEIIGEGE